MLDTLRLPCFATGCPAALITKALVVDILKVFAQSPPVPTISRTSPFVWIRLHFSRSTCAQAVISSIVSPFMRMAVIKAAIWALVAPPLIIWLKASRVSVPARFCPAASLAIAVLIIFKSPLNISHSKNLQVFSCRPASLPIPRYHIGKTLLCNRYSRIISGIGFYFIQT